MSIHLLDLILDLNRLYLYRLHYQQGSSAILEVDTQLSGSQGLAVVDCAC